MEQLILTMQDFVRTHVLIHIVLIALACAVMIVAMGIDLFFGIQKARQLGQATTSKGLKRTCDKAKKYFSPFLVLVCLDLLTSVIIPLPIFSLLWAGYCVFCEFLSVREKSWEKAEIREQEQTMSIILKNRKDIAEAIVEAYKMLEKKK